MSDPGVRSREGNALLPRLRPSLRNLIVPLSVSEVAVSTCTDRTAARSPPSWSRLFRFERARMWSQWRRVDLYHIGASCTKVALEPPSERSDRSTVVWFWLSKGVKLLFHTTHHMAPVSSGVVPCTRVELELSLSHAKKASCV